MITQIQEPVIWFDFLGDEVCWNGDKYISLLSGGAFDSLEELEQFWTDFYEEMGREHFVTREMALDAGDPSLEGNRVQF